MNRPPRRAPAHERLAWIAATYGVTMKLSGMLALRGHVRDRWVERPSWWRDLRDHHGSDGPNGDTVIDPKTRTVHHDQPLEQMEFSRGLHEIVHAFMQPPGVRFDKVDESVALFPIERAIARACCDDEDHHSVVTYQRDTVIAWCHPGSGDNCVAAWLQETRSHWWRTARARCRELGVLTASGVPTWRPPDFSRWRPEWHKEHWV